MIVVSDSSPLHHLVLIEAEAIGLALTIQAKALLIDERDGTRDPWELPETARGRLTPWPAVYDPAGQPWSVGLKQGPAGVD